MSAELIKKTIIRLFERKRVHIDASSHFSGAPAYSGRATSAQLLRSRSRSEDSSVYMPIISSLRAPVDHYWPFKGQ